MLPWLQYQPAVPLQKQFDLRYLILPELEEPPVVLIPGRQVQVAFEVA